MRNALILHGTFGDHNGNWFPWLEKELLNRGFKVWTPDLPKADKPNIRRYNKFIFKKWKLDKDSIIIGHSSGAVALLGLLQELPKDVIINKAILVAGFLDDLGWEPLNELFLTTFDWKKIKNQSKQFILIHSDDDPYVPLHHGQKLKELLNGELIIFHNQGHFNLEKGPQFRKFPKLLAKILE